MNRDLGYQSDRFEWARKLDCATQGCETPCSFPDAPYGVIAGTERSEPIPEWTSLRLTTGRHATSWARRMVTIRLTPWEDADPEPQAEDPAS